MPPSPAASTPQSLRLSISTFEPEIFFVIVDQLLTTVLSDQRKPVDFLREVALILVFLLLLLLLSCSESRLLVVLLRWGFDVESVQGSLLGVFASFGVGLAAALQVLVRQFLYPCFQLSFLFEKRAVFK